MGHSLDEQPSPLALYSMPLRIWDSRAAKHPNSINCWTLTWTLNGQPLMQRLPLPKSKLAILRGRGMRQNSEVAEQGKAWDSWLCILSSDCWTRQLSKNKLMQNQTSPETPGMCPSESEEQQIGCINGTLRHFSKISSLCPILLPEIRACLPVILAHNWFLNYSR